MPTKIEHLIVDAAGFIDRTPLHEYGTNLYTVQEVLDEVTNRRQKADLAAMPCSLNVLTVFPEHVRFVVDFAKKTGDYPSLSATDIKVIALACQVYRSEYGADGLRAEPAGKSVVFGRPRAAADRDAIPGFYDPDGQQPLCNAASRLKIADQEETNSSEIDNDQSFDDRGDDAQGSDDRSSEDRDTDNSEDYKDSDNDDDGGGWITEHNIQHLKKNAGDVLLEDSEARVGCITTDYAVQNVIKQIGLSVVALDGRVIREVRTYIRRCYGCFALTPNMTRMFCPKCGNKSLKRVAVYLDKDGKQCVYVNGKRPLNLRGKKFSLPKPQGGKHAVNPRLVEDQPMPHQRPSRLAKTKTNAMDPDYVAKLSPFAIKDVYSKSAMLGFKGSSQKQWMKRNPNESNKKCKK